MSRFFLIMYFIKTKTVKLKVWLKPTKAVKFTTSLLTYSICLVNVAHNRKVGNFPRPIVLSTV